MSKKQGTINGRITQANAKQGTHQVKVFGFIAANWGKSKADISDPIPVILYSQGLAGQPVQIQFFESDNKKPGHLIDTQNVTISGDTTTFQWKFPKDKLKNQKPSQRASSPLYYFVAKCTKVNRSMPSDIYLQVTASIKIVLLDDKNKGVANEPFTIYLPDKSKIDKKTDGSGKAEIKNIKLGGTPEIKFNRNSLIAPDKPVRIESPQTIQKYNIDYFSDNKFYTDNCVIRCSHKVQDHYRYVLNPPFFEIVQEAPKYNNHYVIAGQRPKPENDMVIIYTGQKKKLTEKAGNVIKENKQESGYNRYDMECSHEQKDNTELFFLPSYWKQLKTPTEYKIDGLRNSLPIKYFKPDQYSLSIQFPAIEEYTAGEKFSKTLSSIANEGSKAPVINKSKPLKCEDKSWAFNKEGLPFSSDKPIVYKINNKEVTVSAVDALGSLLLMITKFQRIIELIKGNVPEAGLYIKFGMKIFEGTFGIEWGWKEYIDHRAFMRIAAIFDVTLFSVNFEFGIGVSGFSCKLQVFALIEDKLSLSFNGERVSPDNTVEIAIPIKNTFEGSVGARFEAGYIVKIEGKVTTGIEIKGQFKINTSEGVSVNGTIDWTGVKASITVSANVGKSNGNKDFSKDSFGEVETNTLGSGKREYTLIESANLGQFQWPSQEKYQPKFIPREKVVEIFKSVFTKGINVRVRDASGSEIDLNKIANQFADYIDKWKDIERSERSIEAIAFNIRARLQELSDRPNWHSVFKSVDYNKYTGFIKKQLPGILGKAIDPAIAAMNKLKSYK